MTTLQLRVSIKQWSTSESETLFEIDDGRTGPARLGKALTVRWILMSYFGSKVRASADVSLCIQGEMCQIQPSAAVADLQTSKLPTARDPKREGPQGEGPLWCPLPNHLAGFNCQWTRPLGLLHHPTTAAPAPQPCLTALFPFSFVQRFLSHNGLSWPPCTSSEPNGKAGDDGDVVGVGPTTSPTYVPQDGRG